MFCFGNGNMPVYEIDIYNVIYETNERFDILFSKGKEYMQKRNNGY